MERISIQFTVSKPISGTPFCQTILVGDGSQLRVNEYRTQESFSSTTKRTQMLKRLFCSITDSQKVDKITSAQGTRHAAFALSPKTWPSPAGQGLDEKQTSALEFSMFTMEATGS